MGERDATELDLRGYLRVLGRRKWLIVLIAGAVLGAGLAFSLSKTPMYRASAELLIAPKRSETLFNGSNTQVAQETSRYVATEIKVLTSEAVRDVAAEKLGFQARVRAYGSAADNVVTVSADSVDPERAAEVVNTYVAAYIDYRRQASVTDSLKAQEVIQRQVDEKQKAIDALSRIVQRAPVPQRAALAESQEDQRASLVRQQDLFRNQIDQLQIGAGLNSGEAQLLTRAEVPSEPFDPKPVTAGVMYLLLGLALSIGIAFVLEVLDDSLRSKEDLDRITGGLPVLGMIPVVRGWRRHGKAYTVTMAEPTSVAAESYRSLRTSIQFLGLDRPIRTLQLTSPAASEGKTTTVANLAAALADAGQRVVIVDCDLRRSRVHEFFGLTNSVGFTSVLLGEVPLSEALYDVPGVDRLQVLAAGPRPPNPSELLSGRRTLEVFTALQSHADIVVIDSPPVLPVSDAVVLAAQVDATLLVTNARKTHGRPLGRAMELLRQVDAPLIGSVLNLASADAAYGYGYGYGYGYKDSSDDDRKRDRVPARST